MTSDQCINHYGSGQRHCWTSHVMIQNLCIYASRIILVGFHLNLQVLMQSIRVFTILALTVGIGNFLSKQDHIALGVIYGVCSTMMNESLKRSTFSFLWTIHSSLYENSFRYTWINWPSFIYLFYVATHLKCKWLWAIYNKILLKL